ncbi:PE-PGRS family protein [Gracilaria domingensis]|nr:PE-PGRS family protein [Gracilaria domingensis]
MPPGAMMVYVGGAGYSKTKRAWGAVEKDRRDGAVEREQSVGKLTGRKEQLARHGGGGFGRVRKNNEKIGLGPRTPLTAVRTRCHSVTRADVAIAARWTGVPRCQQQCLSPLSYQGRSRRAAGARRATTAAAAAAAPEATRAPEAQPARACLHRRHPARRRRRNGRRRRRRRHHGVRTAARAAAAAPLTAAYSSRDGRDGGRRRCAPRSKRPPRRAPRAAEKRR